MSYRKRENPIPKICPQCHSTFHTWHVGRMYCGQACNMTAWRQRHKTAITKATPAPVNKLSGNLRFSIPNVALLAAPPLIMTLANYTLNDKPAHDELVSLVTDLGRRIGRGMGQLAERLETLQDHQKALEQQDPTLAFKVVEIRQKRLKQPNRGH